MGECLSAEELTRLEPMPTRSISPLATAAIIALLIGCTPSASQSQSRPSPSAAAETASLEATIRARLDSLPAQSSFYGRHLATGQEVAVRADVPMNTASVIKIPVMILAFRDADAGRLNLDERYTIRPEDIRRGSGLLQTFASGLQPTMRDIVTQMIITSDNTATDIMVAKVGRDRVNRMLDSLGYRETRVLDVNPGQTTSLTIEAAEGIVRINAPAGTEVSIDGQRVGVTPLGDLHVAIGSREIVCKHPQLGQQRVVTDVTRSAPVEVNIDFGKR